MSDTTKEVVVGSHTFYINLFDGRTALRLDRQVLRILAPALSGLDGVKELKGKSLLDAEINFGMIGRGISDSLSLLGEEEFDSFVNKMLSQTFTRGAGDQAIPVLSQFDALFNRNFIDLYRLLFEVMRFNRFTPFALVGGGGGIGAMLGFKKEQSGQKKSGKESEKSES